LLIISILKIVKKQLFTLLFLIFSLGVFGQKASISGYVIDSETGEKLIGAAVFDLNNQLNGTITNAYGFFSLTVPVGKINLAASYVGYTIFQQDNNLDKDIFLTIELKQGTQLNEINIVADHVADQVQSPQMSVISVPINTLKSVPVILGEVDVLKAIQLLPGVKSGTEATSGIYVRGGSADQNLILLDGVPVYNVNHLFGFFSIFNADAVNDVTLIKGGFPAQYGGRLSSVIDIRMKEGNKKKFSGQGSVGLIATKLTLEGPVFSENTTFIVSYRRTYMDLLIAPLIKLFSSNEDVKTSLGYYFWDLNAKINHTFSNRSRLYFSLYAGADKAYIKAKIEDADFNSKNSFYLRWGNTTAALRWNYIWNSKLFSNTTATYSYYAFITELKSENTGSKGTSAEYMLKYISGIEDFAFKIDFDYSPLPSNNIRFGGSNTYHTFKPGLNTMKLNFNSEYSSENVDTIVGNRNVYANEVDVYVEDDIKISKAIRANAGIHYSMFYVQQKSFHSIQPRISMRFLLSEKFSWKAAYSQMSQNLHLLTNSSLNMPTDLWLPATAKVKPQKSWQVASGFSWKIHKLFQLSSEVFYKEMDGLIEYKEGTQLFNATGSWEDKIEEGKGKSYGLEILLEKKAGKNTGWIGYTWSKTTRIFENLNYGNEFPYKYDRTHDFSIVWVHEFTEHVNMGLNWVFSTGNAVSLPVERYKTAVNNNNYYSGEIEYYKQRNSFRMPAYHRLDVGFNLHKRKKWGERTWSFSVYNLYNRKNPMALGFENNGSEKKLVQYSMFPFISSVSYNFKF